MGDSTNLTSNGENIYSNFLQEYNYLSSNFKTFSRESELLNNFTDLKLSDSCHEEEQSGSDCLVDERNHMAEMPDIETLLDFPDCDDAYLATLALVSPFENNETTNATIIPLLNNPAELIASLEVPEIELTTNINPELLNNFHKNLKMRKDPLYEDLVKFFEDNSTHL
ncbi:hypothetical protein RF11_10124 [Thelohanellus kitauei]|uniref:Uncharacterized protein n=1 Tax=Thelohanellus kitauei TaxID=669202 RepID=A0A0C2IKS3_THEKT|nr:hypothetical protein RF11_10124 [Thelohanellus kitauei]